MMVEILWYCVAVFAVWGSALGGVAVPAVGLLYPYRIAAAVLFIILAVKSGRKGWNVGRQTWFTVFPVLGYMILHSLLSLLWAQDVLRTAKVILNFLFIAAFLLMFLRMAKDRKSLNNLLIALSVNFVAIMAIGYYELFSNMYLFCDTSGVDMSWRLNAFGLSYPVVCFTNPNDFAFALSIMTPLMLYVLDEALEMKPWARTACKCAVLLLTFFILMNTSSRLGYIVYFLVVAIYLLLQIRKSKIESALLVLLAAFLALTLVGVIKIDFRAKHTGKPAAGTRVDPITAMDVEDASTQIRLMLIKKGLRVAKDTWGLGAGAKNSPVYMSSYTDLDIQGSEGVTDFHFFYMEVLADYGVLPLLMLLCFQAGAFFSSIHILRKRPEQRWLALCALPSSVGFALASGNCSSSMFVYMMWIQFGVWSLAASTVGVEWLEKWKQRKRKQ